MKRSLRILSAAIVVGAVICWVATGSHRGWTQNNIPTKIVDPVTGNEGVVYKHGFVAGVDFLAACVGVAVVVLGVSFLVPNKKLDC